MQQNNLLFDLDGTLTDPKTGITRCVAYALDSFGIEVTDHNALCAFIGPPHKGSFMEFYGFSETDAVKAVAKYRERYTETGMFENEVYEGVPQMLHTLKEAGKRLFVATSKPTVYAKQILSHFHLMDYFEFVSGSNLDLSRCDKADVIRYALDQRRLDPSDSVMIGDRFYDIQGAQETGLASVGVLYGYGAREELQSHGADFIVEDVPALAALLLK